MGQSLNLVSLLFSYGVVSKKENYKIVFRLLGPNKLIAYALNEWLTDIRKNQLPSVLGGVGPMHSIVQLGNHSFEYFCCGFS